MGYGTASASATTTAGRPPAAVHQRTCPRQMSGRGGTWLRNAGRAELRARWIRNCSRMSTPVVWGLSPRDPWSVNDNIDRPLGSLTYVRVQGAAEGVLSFGRDSLLAKVGTYPCTQRIGGCWHGGLYVDKTLPFGLRSAPTIFRHWPTQWSGWRDRRE